MAPAGLSAPARARIAKPCFRRAGRCSRVITNGLADPAAAAAATFNVSVRPYTLRKSDTIESISRKRGITVEELLNINPDVHPDKITEGYTILLPAAKLSSRDKEILDGIGPIYRVYPVRGGESLTDIISKRKITLDEMRSFNPSIDFEKPLQEGQLLKLPSNKFTVREREMLIGAGVLPPEFFEVARNPFAIGGGILLMLCGFVMAWQQFYRDPDQDYEDDDDAAPAPAQKQAA